MNYTLTQNNILDKNLYQFTFKDTSNLNYFMGEFLNYLDFYKISTANFASMTHKISQGFSINS